MRLDRFAGFAWGVLAYNLLVILWGAYVRATGSGAGCGSHWPLCNGEVVPRAAAVETLVELTHRVTSGIALLAVIALFIWARRAHPAGTAVRLGATLSLVFIVIEALLGAGLVLFELVADDDSWARAFSMIAHLVNTFILVATLSLTAWWATGGRPVELRGHAPRLAAIGTGLLALLAVGATGAIAALGDTLFPAASLGEGLRESFSAESHPLLQLRKYHPLLAILVGAYIAGASRYLARMRPTPDSRRLATLTVGLVAAQIGAGAVNVILLAPVPMQLFHLLLADLLWIAFVLLAAAVLQQAPVRTVAGDAGLATAAHEPLPYQSR